MPLVPQPVYAAWFSKTSWVYRHFCYLFQNPLWSKDVPKGFSLCPFFWMALFSMAVFRPLVYTVIALRSLVSLFRLGKVLAFTDALVARVTGDGPRGMPTVAGLLVCAVAGSVLASVGSGLLFLTANGILSVVLLPVTLAATLIACGVYAKYHEGEENRCRVEIYTHLMAAACMALAAVLQTEFFLASFVEFPIDVVSVIWGGLCFIVSSVVSGIIYLLAGIVVGVKSIWIALIGFGAVAGYGWLIMRFGLGPVSSGDTTPQPRRLTRKQIEANASDLVDLAWRHLHETNAICHSWTYFRSIGMRTPEVRDIAEITAAAAATPEQVEQLSAAILVRIKADEARKAARSETCKRMTAFAEKLWSPFRFVLRQGRILSSYLWAFLKARKAGACPYLRFQD